MGGEVNELLAKVAADFDALAGQVERKIEMLAEEYVCDDEIKRLRRIMVIAKRGAAIARSKPSPQ